jgi:hypothetical protein
MMKSSRAVIGIVIDVVKRASELDVSPVLRFWHQGVSVISAVVSYMVIHCP